MALTELIVAKEKCERDIQKAVDTFHSITGLRISKIDTALSYIPDGKGSTTRVNTITLDVRL